MLYVCIGLTELFVMKKIVFLTGAGVSAESGIKTFRDSDGLWENYPVEDVATIDAWYRNPALMLKFYNERRAQLKDAKPNAAHIAIAALEKLFDVTVVTQNIDNLHEQAGSSKIIHLHGECTKVRPQDSDGSFGVIDIGYKPVNLGQTDERGVQLRPHIVWFGEGVPMMEPAIDAVSHADMMVIVGTSMVVYPAAGLVNYVRMGTPIYLVDPKPINLNIPNFVQIQDVASKGMQTLTDIIKELEK